MNGDKECCGTYEKETPDAQEICREKCNGRKNESDGEEFLWGDSFCWEGAIGMDNGIDGFIGDVIPYEGCEEPCVEGDDGEENCSYCHWSVGLESIGEHGHACVHEDVAEEFIGGEGSPGCEKREWSFDYYVFSFFLNNCHLFSFF